MNSERFDGLSPLAAKPLPTEPVELQREVLLLRDDLIGLRARLAEAEVVIKRMSEMKAIGSPVDAVDHVEYLMGVVNDLEKQLAAVKSSSTWRIGRALLFPVRLVKRS